MDEATIFGISYCVPSISSTQNRDGLSRSDSRQVSHKAVRTSHVSVHSRAHLSMKDGTPRQDGSRRPSERAYSTFQSRNSDSPTQRTNRNPRSLDNADERRPAARNARYQDDSKERRDSRSSRGSNQPRLRNYSQPYSGTGREGNYSSSSRERNAQFSKDQPPPTKSRCTTPIPDKVAPLPAWTCELGGIKLPDTIWSVLKDEMNISEATKIQLASMERLVGGENLFLNAETGSGKTLAFLLPLLAQLEYRAHKAQADSKASKWHGVIVVPSRELALQIFQVWNTLQTPFKASVLYEPMEVQDIGNEDGGESVLAPNKAQTMFADFQKRNDLDSASVIIASASALFNTLDASAEFREELKERAKYLVLDEADRMIDVPGKYASIKTKTNKRILIQRKPAVHILQYLTELETSANEENNHIQVIASSATMGRPFRRAFASLMNIHDMKLMPDIVYGMDMGGMGSDSELSSDESKEESDGPKTTRKVYMPTTIQHVYMPVEDQTPEFNQRVAILHALMLKIAPQRALIVIPQNQSIQSTLGVLHSLGWKSAKSLSEAYGFISGKYDRDVILQQSQAIHTLGRKSSIETQQPDELAPQQQPDFLLVTTFGATRGLHIHNVDHVFIVGGTPSIEEYMHAAGRTGRNGQSGTIVSLVSWPESKQLKSYQSPLQFKLEKWTMSQLNLFDGM